MSSSDPKLHPCERVFGECAGGDECRFKDAPREACLANLKGRCKYGERCNELHVTMYKESYVPEVHPCIRIFGSCRYGDECEFKNLPALTCIKFLRGKCINGARCEEIHLARGAQASAAGGAYGGYHMTSAPVYGGIGVKRSRDDTSADGEKRQRQQQQQQQQFQTYLNPYMDPQAAMANYYYAATAAAYNTTAAVPKTHPCLRIFGSCRHGQHCRYINYPFEACLQHLRGKCRFKDSCNELHVALPGSGYEGGGSSRSTKPTSQDMNSLHPCFRIYGCCRDGEACPYAKYPQHYCLQYLKGRCKFGDRCNEFHASQSEIDGSSSDGPPGEE